MSSSDGQTSTVQPEVKEIAKLLSMAAKNYQMYLSNNRMFTTSLENLRSSLDAFLEENEILTFVVREFELLHRNDPVYSNTDKYQSIAFRMYRDGVRLISFHKGIANDDLMAFFEALTRCMETDNLEEDFVTLLWEKDLQAITYYEVNDFEADYESLKKKAGEEYDTTPHLNTSALSEAPWKRVTDQTEELKPTITLTPEDLAEVRDLTLTVDDELFLRRAGQVLLMTLELDDTHEACLDMETAFNGYLDTCVWRRQIAAAAEMLTHLKRRYAKNAGEEVDGVLSRIIAARHSERNMATIGEILASGRETERDDCRIYLSQLSVEAIPAVFKVLPHCTNQSARHVLVSSLAAIGNANPVQILRCADRAPAEEVELALDVLEVIAEKDSLAGIMQLEQHSSPRVRVKVATIAARLKTERAQEVAESLIRDEDHSVRRRALISLIEIRGEESVDTLVSLFTSNDFHLLSHDSKLSMLLVIKTLPPIGQQRVIDAVFRMRRFFRRRPMDDTKAALLEIMHLMNEHVTQESLGWLVKHSSGRLRQSAKTALKKVNDDRRTHRNS
jgi:HEAT repeat protein